MSSNETNDLSQDGISGGTEAGNAAPEPNRPPRAEDHHQRQLDLFKRSLEAEGEAAYQRWGLPLFHSLSDTDAQAQRHALGAANQDAHDFYNQGCLLAEREDYKGAAENFSRSLELKSDNPEAAYNLALAIERSGKTADARAAWGRFLEQYPDHEDIRDVRQHLGELAEA